MELFGVRPPDKGRLEDIETGEPPELKKRKKTYY